MEYSFIRSEALSPSRNLLRMANTWSGANLFLFAKVSTEPLHSNESILLLDLDGYQRVDYSHSHSK